MNQFYIKFVVLYQFFAIVPNPGILTNVNLQPAKRPVTATRAYKKVAETPQSHLQPVQPPPPAPTPPPAPDPPPPPQSFPVAPEGTYSNGYAFGNCTWYVAGRKQLPDSWGNAATWGVRAAADGITVSSVPLVGAIAQRAGGLGHVAIVLEVSGDQVRITEMNSAGFDMVDERWMPIATYNYIYI